MTRILKRGAGLAFATALAFGTAASAHAAERVKFQLDWIPGGDKAAIYYGVSLGLFEDVGIEIAFVPGRGSSDALTKLATGVSDVGTAGIGALMTAAAEGGIPVKALFSIYTRQPDAILTTEGGGIGSIADLAGKTIATATFSSSNVTWPLLLRINGIDEASIKLLKVDPGALAPMLATGRVDGTINWVTVAPIAERALAEGGKSLKVLEWSEYGLDGYGMVALASDKMIAQRPAVLKAFTAAYMKAILAANKNPEAAAAAMKEIVPETDVALAADTYAASIPLIENEVSAADGFGAFTRERMDLTWKWVAESQGYGIDAIDPLALLDTSFSQ